MTAIRSLLAPAAVLLLWSGVMLIWMMVTRMPALRAAGIDISKLTGGRGADAERVLPAEIQWKAHNYNHLLEQPTLFYAVVLVLAVAGGATPLTIGLAWAYAALRIIHSLWQALINRVLIRFILFAISSLCLVALTILAVILTLS